MIAPIKLDLRLNISDTPVHLCVTTDFDTRTKWNVARHCNANYEVHIILSGSCTLIVDERSHPLHSSSAMLIPPGQFHYPCDPSDYLERLTFSFTVAPGDLSNQMRQIKECIPCELSANTMVLCQEILSELSEQNPFSQDSLTSLFSLLLIQLLRSCELHPRVQDNPSTNAAALRTATIDKFFSPWPGNFDTEEDLAKQLHLSRRQLNRVLLQHYGMNFREKMLQARMEWAGWLLLTTDKTISEIGLLVGYTAESSFFKAFRAYYHTTPQSYRKNIANKEDY